MEEKQYIVISSDSYIDLEKQLNALWLKGYVLVSHSTIHTSMWPNHYAIVYKKIDNLPINEDDDTLVYNIEDEWDNN